MVNYLKISDFNKPVLNYLYHYEFFLKNFPFSFKKNYKNDIFLKVLKNPYIFTNNIKNLFNFTFKNGLFKSMFLSKKNYIPPFFNFFNKKNKMHTNRFYTQISKLRLRFKKISKINLIVKFSGYRPIRNCIGSKLALTPLTPPNTNIKWVFSKTTNKVDRLFSKLFFYNKYFYKIYTDGVLMPRLGTNLNTPELNPYSIDLNSLPNSKPNIMFSKTKGSDMDNNIKLISTNFLKLLRHRFKKNLINTNLSSSLFFNKLEIFINTKSTQTFILINLNFYIMPRLLTNYLKHPQNRTRKLYLDKKTMYTFYYIYELRHRFMAFKKKINFFSTFSDYKKNIFKNNYNFLFLFKKSIKKLFFLKNALLNNTGSVNYSDPNIKVWDSAFVYKQHYQSNFDKNLYLSDNSLLEQKINTGSYSEVHIPRVKFKPGYQRVWRLARTALKEVLSLKFIYQQQLTKYVSKLSRFGKSFFFNREEMSIKKIITYANLIPDEVTLNSFFIKKLIYINGKLIRSLSDIVYKNDILQVIVSLWYYVVMRWLLNAKLLREIKFKRLIYKKNIPRKYKLIKHKKQKSNYLSKWVFYMKYDLLSVRSFLEVDFLTLSAIVIYDPSILYYKNRYNFLNPRFNIYKLYNWKYIT